MSDTSYNMIMVPTVVGVAIETISGMYGIGEDRKKNITAAGYDYERVQSCVNELFPILLKYKDD